MRSKKNTYKSRIRFRGMAQRLKTNEVFKNKKNGIFHKGQTLVDSISKFKFVDNVSIDNMHCVCLGATRKVMNLWVSKSPLEQRMDGRSIHYKRYHRDDVYRSS